MPRTADQGLEKRILQAAQRLWHSRGDEGLTLRAVARDAGTTTTTVYKRFRNKDELRSAVAERVRQRLAKVTLSSARVEDLYRRYLQFARTHPREYKLLFGPAWIHVAGVGRPRPVKEWIMAQLAARFGGVPEDYGQVFDALFLLTHGAASLIAVAPRSRANEEAEVACIAICDLLLKKIEIFREDANKREVTEKRPATEAVQ
jgi:AcrR family transcriptional regulator